MRRGGGRERRREDGREEGREEGRAGSLESQFEEWLKSLDIKSGVWGPLLTNLFAFFLERGGFFFVRRMV